MGEIARGGMGVVYRARQISLNRLVALKMIASGQLTTDAQVQRFRIEAEAAARLDHPNIVSIYEVGEQDGQYFYSMKLIEGGSLATDARSSWKPVIGWDPRAPTAAGSGRAFPTGRDRPKQVASLIARVAQALEHAHQRGVLHRDLKPSNILLDETGQPFLADFGLARLDDMESGLTRTHTVIGTPHYMSPEQAAGGVHDLTTASDLFSLGAVFYELLVGRQAFRGNSTVAILQAVREATPPRPRSLDPAIDRDLETICLKCLEKDPTRRYASARALVEDLDRWMQGKPIAARPVRAFERAWLWARHRPALAGLAAAFALAMVLGIAGVIWQSMGRQRALRELRRTLYIAQMQAAEQAWNQGDLELTRSLLRGQIPRRDEEDLRGFEWRYFGTLCRDGSTLTFSNDVPAGIESVAIHPEGALLAWGDAKGRVHLIRTTDWREIHAFSGHRGGLATMEFSRDGKWLITGGADRLARLWDTGTWKCRADFCPSNAAPSIVVVATLSPDGSMLATGGASDPDLHLWDVASGRELAAIPGAAGIARLAAFSSDGKQLAVSDVANRVLIWDATLLREIRRLSGHRSIVSVVKYSPSGQWIASADASGLVKLWSTDSGREAGTLVGHRDRVLSLAFSSDSRLLASACGDGTIKLWNLAEMTEIHALRGHQGAVNGITFSSDGKWLASGGDDHSLKIWEIPRIENRPTFQREPILHGPSWAHLQFSPDGKVLATLGSEAPARRLWRPETGELIATLAGGPDVGSFSGDSKLFAASGSDATIRVWSVHDGHEIASLPLGTNQAVAVTFCRSTLIATSGTEDHIQRWDWPSRRVLTPWAGYEGGILKWLLSPDESTLAVACRDGSIRLRDVRSEGVLPSLPHAGAMSVMAFSPDARFLAVSMSATTPSTDLWEIRGARAHRWFGSRSHGWFPPAFSADGRILAVPGTRAKIDLWDLSRFAHLGEFDWTGEPPASVAFSHDGRSLAIADHTSTLRFWSLPMQTEVITISVPGGGRAFFSPDRERLVIQSNYRQNLLMRAASLAEVEAELFGITLSNQDGWRALPKAGVLP